ncbi:MAG TPA: SDR family oxidoreductase [Gammaproteobacteria bacterium]
MRRVVIVGCGYIGQRVAQQLLKTERRVLGFVRSQQSLDICKQKGIDCQLLDLDDRAAEFEFGANFYDSVVIYLAPPQTKGGEDLRMQHFLRLIDQQAPAKFVLISTTGVYGDCGGDWIDEATPAEPKVDRAKRRFSAEQQVREYCSNRHVPLIILRVPGIYGPGKFPLERIRKAAPIVREEDSPFSNRIHAADLVNICIKSITNDTLTGIYNCADGHPTTMYDYFTKVAKAHKLPAPPVISLAQAKKELSSGMLSYMEESRRISNTKLLRDFNLSLQYPDLDAGLKDIARD